MKDQCTHRIREAVPTTFRAVAQKVPETPFLLLVLLFGILGEAYGRLTEASFSISPRQLFAPRLLSALLLYVILLACYHILVGVLIHRRSLVSGDLWKDLWSLHLRPPVALRALVTVGAVSALMTTFVWFKSLIPTLNPFRWDAVLSRIDAALHGGIQPWEHLNLLLASSQATWLVDRAYLAWYPIVLMVVVWQAWSGREPVRSQFFLAYGLTWILLGVVAATALSSAGPCYFGEVTGLPDPYDPLMARLREIDVNHQLGALHLQDYLWRGYTGQESYAIEGISAMPSLHVAVAGLIALVLHGYSAILRIASWAFVGVTLLGSVLLGWHYAIDGYLAIILVLIVWWIAGSIQTGSVRITNVAEI